MNKETIGSPHFSNSRRTFLKDSTKVLGGAMIGAHLQPHIFESTHRSEPIRIALVGCGDRGAGAVVNALMTKENVMLVAMADIFRDQLDATYANLMKVDEIQDRIRVPEAHKFAGLDAYEKAIALADAVLLVTPAAFRPEHFEACIKAGKHVFMEKPLASDAPGIRKILETGKLADMKNLKVVVGLQNRYDPGYQDMVRRIQKGAIGRIVSVTDYYLIGPVKEIRRRPGQTELEYQLRNWRYFNWLWAGSPAGLQIHNTDVVNWVKNAYPVRAQGMGGRTSLNGPEHGDIFDHFFIEYEYADGTKLNSQIRHVAGTWNKGGANFWGCSGSASFWGGIKNLKGKQTWKNTNKDAESAYQIEHDVFFDAIRNNKRLNDTEWGANSTMTAIMGRMAAHSGKMVEWDEALNSNIVIAPAHLDWNSAAPVQPDKNGNYPIPTPGVSAII